MVHVFGMGLAAIATFALPFALVNAQTTPGTTNTSAALPVSTNTSTPPPPGPGQQYVESSWPFGTIKKPMDFKGAYYAPAGQGCRVQIVFKKDLLDLTLSYSVTGIFNAANTTMTYTHLAADNPNEQLSYASPDAGIGLRGAYALKGSGSTEADEKYEGYGLQPIEIASACNNAKPPDLFRVHAQGANGQGWDSAPFNISSYSTPPAVKQPGGNRATPLSTQAAVYWDDVEGTAVKPQGSFVLSFDPTKNVVDSHFIVSVNHTSIPAPASQRIRVEVVRFNLDGNGALSPTLDAAHTTV